MKRPAFLIAVLLYSAPFPGTVSARQIVEFTPEQLERELAKPDAPPRTKLPLAELESRMRDASPESAPRLVSATYRARWVQPIAGDGYLAGSSEWKIAAADVRQLALSVEPLQLAVTAARWRGGSRVEWLVPDGTAGLRLRTAGAGTAEFDWTLRGTVEPGEERFDIQVPACPVNFLELDLPAGYRPYPQQEVLLEGPMRQDGGADRWKILFGGQSRLTFAPRRESASAETVIRSRSTVRQSMSANRFTADYEIDLEIGRAGTAELLLLYDADQMVQQVSLPGRFEWTSEPTPNRLVKRLRIRLGEPLRTGRLQVRTTGPPPADGASWTSPAVRIPNAVSRGETLELTISSDLRADGWQAGTFRSLTGWRTAADGTESISLQAALPPAGASEQRPSFSPRARGGEFSVEQSLELALREDRASLRQKLALQVGYGNVSVLSIRIPADWEVERVEVPGESAPEWAARGAELLVEPRRVWMPGTAHPLEVIYRRRLPAQEEFRLPFPAAPVRGVADQNAVLTVAPQPYWRAVPDLPAFDPLVGWLAESRREFRWRDKPPRFGFRLARAAPSDPTAGADPTPGQNLDEPKWSNLSTVLRAEQNALVGTLRGRYAGGGRLRLIPGIGVTDVLVEGLAAAVTGSDKAGASSVLLPAAPGPRAVEIHYRIPLYRNWLESTAERTLPVDVDGPVQVEWRLPPDWETDSPNPLPASGPVPAVFRHTEGVREGMLLGLLSAAIVGAIIAGRRNRQSLPAAILAIVALPLLSLSAYAFQNGEPKIPVIEEKGVKFAFAPTAWLDGLSGEKEAEPVVLDAEYTGRLRESTAEFQLKWRLAVPAAGAAYRFALPDARLRQVLLDGEPAFPKSLGGDRYEIRLPREGDCELRVRVDAPVIDFGSECEIRFGVPELPQARLALLLPAEAKDARILSSRGEQSVRPSRIGRMLSADLGRAKAVQIRWGNATPPRAEIREVHRLEIESASIRLLSAYEYDMKQGSLRHLKLSVPAEWRIARLDIRSDAPNAGIRDWQRGPPAPNNPGEMAIELQSALGGRFRLLVECVPARPPARSFAVRWPVALDGPSLDCHFGWSQTGWEKVTLEENKSLAEIVPVEATWRDAARPLFGPAAPPAPIQLFRRLGRGQPNLKFTLN